MNKEKAAVQGDADAQNNLGFCYENGMGIPRNATEAEVWYGKAAKQGFEAAVKKMEKLQEVNLSDFITSGIANIDIF